MRLLIQFEKKPLLFSNPIKLFICHNPKELKNLFSQLELALASGLYVGGFLSYEAGYCWEDKLTQDKDYDFPLAYFGVYSHPLNKTLEIKERFLRHQLRDMRLNVSKERYFNDIEKIRDYIRKGDVYQITYCLKLLFTFSGNPWAFYKKLFQQQPVPYPAYLEAEGFTILSLSPELFLKKSFDYLITKPMKGTWPRRGNPFFDLFSRMRFQYDSKNRAENVMIADLLRNDLGRVGEVIRCPRLFEVTKYRTLFQMTSTVSARVKPDISLYELFGSIFPSGSVTGAPKIRAMEIIRELEREDRHIYTGCIGYITPKKDLFFNIPIRTILLKEGQAQMGIGGGIVWDSTPEGEWQEGLLKAKFITSLADSPLVPH